MEKYKRFTFYITPEFENTWESFLKIIVPRAEKAYKQGVVKRVKQVKAANGKLYDRKYVYKQRDFISTTIRDMISLLVNNAKKKTTVTTEVAA